MSALINMALTALGDFWNNMPDIVLPLAVFAIPIVAILTGHQRKMAQLIHKSHQHQAVDPRVLAELSNLRAEVAQLRDTVNQQVLAADRTSAYLPPPVEPEQRQEVRP